ncbi:LOW QUALITY PROTEIN: apolipoprotein L2-like, partial [Clarias gariepinus]
LYRKDGSFRLTFVFGVKAQILIKLFSERRSKMFQFLSDLKEAAVQLDKMKKGSNISTVAGSSVGGGAGGVLSIVGLALAPVTAGVSLALTLTGLSLGVTSGVTGITEMALPLGTDEVIAKAVNLGLNEAKAGQSIPKLAADLPDVGQLAKGTPVALSQSARVGFIGLNAFFIGLDVLFIFKSGTSLAEGSQRKKV